MRITTVILSASIAIALLPGSATVAAGDDSTAGAASTVESPRQRVGDKEVLVVFSRPNGSPHLIVAIGKAIHTPLIYYSDLQVTVVDGRGRKIRIEKAPHEPAWLGEAGSSAGMTANAHYKLFLEPKQEVAKVGVTFQGQRKLFSLDRRSEH